MRYPVDPATGQILTTVPTLDTQGAPTFYSALTFRASDGVLVGGTGSGNSGLSGDIYTIDPATGAQLAHLSNTGLNFVGDLDFRPNYQVCLLYDATKAVKSGATLPVKLQLCDKRRQQFVFFQPYATRRQHYSKLHINFWKRPRLVERQP